MATNDSFYDEDIQEEVEPYQPTLEDLEANEKVSALIFPYEFWEIF